MTKKGDRIKLLAVMDDYTRLRPGDEGTVVSVDDMGTLHVRWDNGSTLGLVPNMDHWEVIDTDFLEAP
jgi:hypothetical protein